MVINMFVAATAGTLIPLGLRALKVDPALASSVFITTLTDVFGFLSFLGLATIFLRFLHHGSSAAFECMHWQDTRQPQRPVSAAARTAMRAYSSDALVLRTYRYGEADQIVVFLTEDRGKKRGVAKNATKSRRRFGGGLESLSRGRAAYVEHETRELVRLDRIETDGCRRFGRRRAAIRMPPRTCWGTRRTSRSCSTSGRPTTRRTSGCSGWARRWPRRCARGGAVDALARYFEYWLLRLEGVYPALDGCPRCGRRSLAAGAVLVLAERTYRVRGLRARRAGAVGRRRWRSCARRAGGRRLTSAPARAERRRACANWSAAHDRLIAMHLEKELRSARVVRELRPGS